MSESGPAGWPAGYESFTIVWTGEEGVDLAEGPAVAISAYIESFFLVELTGDDKYLYPGFSTAVADEWRPRTNSPTADGPWIGTATNHLMSLSRKDSAVSVIGCMYTYGVGSFADNGEYSARGASLGTPEAGISAFKVSLEADPSSVDSTITQSGPARTPSDDVFGGYRVTGYWGGYVSADTMNNRNWPERRQSTDECVAKAPVPLERRNYVFDNYLPASDFPTLPAKPGWPVAPKG
ncbi:hypothetical protein A5719_07620 [Mycolicibacterium peregrinum]|nr:hypothetical protein A5719_07620 [Mycolicibacterium peregrinum]